MIGIKLIAAVDDKLGIAKHNKIPWNLPSDRLYFRSKLERGPVVSGWETYAANGRKPYGHGKNSVITRKDIDIPDINIEHDAKSFFENIQEDIWVSGGGQIFAVALPYATHLYLTRVSGNFGCDTFFPDFTATYILKSEGPVQIENGTAFQFQIWERKSS